MDLKDRIIKEMMSDLNSKELKLLSEIFNFIKTLPKEDLRPEFRIMPDFQILEHIENEILYSREDNK